MLTQFGQRALTTKPAAAPLNPSRYLRAAPRVGAGIILSVCALGALSADLDFEKHFESELEMNCTGNCPTLSSRHAREGSSSMRSFINRKTSPNSYRTSAVIPGVAQKLQFDRDYWYGFSIYLPGDWQVSGKNEIVADFHSTRDPEDKPIGMPVTLRHGREGTWQVLSRREGDTRATFRIWDLNSVWQDVGKWTDWVFHYRPSVGRNGVLKIWKDGTLVVEHYGPNTFDDRIGPYFKIGTYIPAWRDRNCNGCDLVDARVIYHDALRVASGPNAGYGDVAPRGSASGKAVSSPSQPEATSTQPEADAVVSPSLNEGETVLEFANYTNLEWVTGTITIKMEAFDPDGIRNMSWWVDNGEQGAVVARKTSPPWEFVLDTAPYIDAPRIRVQAIKHDADGSRTTSVLRLKAY